MTSHPPNSAPSAVSGNSVPAAQMSAWFLELERLLERIEHAVTHYQVLGLSQSATRENILTAYRQTLGFLFPVAELLAVLPPDTQQRMDRALERTAQSFTALAVTSRRNEYDRTMSGESAPPRPQPAPAPPPVNATPEVPPRVSPPAAPPARPSTAAPAAPGPPSNSPADVLEIRKVGVRQEVFSVSDREDERNRRRSERFKMGLPVRVMGFDRQSGKWHEMTESVDVSRTGLQLHLRRRVMHNTILHLTLPLPLKLRSHGFSETTYNVYALVRRILPQEDGRRLVGLEFIGENPPSGFLEKPWAACRTRQWTGANRRRHPRIDRVEPVTIDFLTEDKKFIAREQGFTENVSRGGVRVKTRQMPPEFDLVRIAAAKFSFESLSVVTNRYLMPDGSARICLQLIEREWPLE